MSANSVIMFTFAVENSNWADKHNSEQLKGEYYIWEMRRWRFVFGLIVLILLITKELQIKITFSCSAFVPLRPQYLLFLE